jgi:2'-5' RNA ligase
VQLAGGRLTAPADLHVTLSFLGAVEEPALAALVTCVSQIQAAAFTLEFDRIEYWRAPRVLVASALHAPAGGRALVQALQDAARGLGLTPDPKPWRPHLTLARAVSPRLPAEARNEPRLRPSLAIAADNFHLAESRHVDQRRYALISSWPLRHAG